VLFSFLSAEVFTESSAAVGEGEFDFLDDFGVVGDGFFGFGGEGDPDRGHVDDDGDGS